MEINEYKNVFEQEESHWWYKGLRKISLNILSDYLKNEKEIKILDAGCGTGINLKELSKFGEVFGVDFSKEAIKFCNIRGIKNLELASVENLPFEDNSFNVITSFEVLYHKEVKSDSKAIKEFCRVLKPGGILMLRLPAFSFLYGQHDDYVHTKKRYNKKDIIPLLKENNFKVLRSTYLNFSLFFPTLLIRTLQNITSKDQKSDIKNSSILTNMALYYLLFLESIYLKIFNFPFGTSLLVIAKKS